MEIIKVINISVLNPFKSVLVNNRQCPVLGTLFLAHLCYWMDKSEGGLFANVKLHSVHFN